VVFGEMGGKNVSVYIDDPEDRVDEKLTAFLQLPPNPVEPSSWFSRNFDGLEQREHSRVCSTPSAARRKNGPDPYRGER
jgi:hypothetical protein